MGPKSKLENPRRCVLKQADSIKYNKQFHLRKLYLHKPRLICISVFYVAVGYYIILFQQKPYHDEETGPKENLLDKRRMIKCLQLPLVFEDLHH